MLDPRKIGIVGTTQEQIPLKTIRDNLVILKDMSVVMILWVGAINFDLLSEEEQEAVIFAYSGLLNSLSFPIQIYIHSQKKDLSLYLNYLDERLKELKQKIMKQRLEEYRHFIQRLVKDKNVLDKKFYLAIPYKPAIFKPPSTEFNLFSLFTKGQKKKKKVEEPTIDLDSLLVKAKNALEPKRDHLIRQLARIGLPARQLTDQELIHLFYSIYNPNQAIKTSSPSEYSSTLVSSNLRSS